jgi:hypothetical protein
MSNESALGFGLLVLLFGLPVILDVSNHALTQAMIVVLGFTLMLSE